MAEYRELLHVVAENPGLTADGISSTVGDIDKPRVLLEKAEANNDVVCVNDRYWVIRKGEFAFREYDHPETTSSK